MVGVAIRGEAGFQTFFWRRPLRRSAEARQQERYARNNRQPLRLKPTCLALTPRRFHMQNFRGQDADPCLLGLNCERPPVSG